MEAPSRLKSIPKPNLIAADVLSRAITFARLFGPVARINTPSLLHLSHVSVALPRQEGLLQMVTGPFNGLLPRPFAPFATIGDLYLQTPESYWVRLHKPASIPTSLISPDMPHTELLQYLHLSQCDGIKGHCPQIHGATYSYHRTIYNADFNILVPEGYVRVQNEHAADIVAV